MAWYVEAVAAPLAVAADLEVVRAHVDDYMATLRGFRPSAPVGQATVNPLTRDTDDTAAPWGTLHVDIREHPTTPGQTRVTVHGCFWGDINTPCLTAPSPLGREHCQGKVDAVASALAGHLQAHIRAGLSGAGLT